MDRESKAIVVGLASKGWKGDSPFGMRMMERLGSILRRFGLELEKAMADAGYSSRVMATKVESLGGEPWIKVRKDAKGRAKSHPAWKRMVRKQRRDLKGFQGEYCYRVVVEGIISALKRLFGPLVSSKRRHNQNLEVMCRLILWNYGRLELG